MLYAEAKSKFKKSTMCYWYLRKRCIFPIKRCKFAHGVADLTIYPYAEHKLIKDTFYTLKEERWALSKTEPKRKEQFKNKSSIDDLLFSSDEEDYFSLGYVPKSVWKTKEDRMALLDFYNENTYELVKMLIGGKEFEKKYIIDQIAANVQLNVKWKDLLSKNLIYLTTAIASPESKKKEELVFLFPKKAEIDAYVIDLFTFSIAQCIKTLPVECNDLIISLYNSSNAKFLPLYTLAKYVYVLLV